MCTTCPVWTLRIYKLHLMEAAGLVTPEEREEQQDTRNPDAAAVSLSRRRSDVVVVDQQEQEQQQKRISMAFVVRSCFAVTKV